MHMFRIINQFYWWLWQLELPFALKMAFFGLFGLKQA